MARRGTVISPVAEQISELSAGVQMSQSFYLASPGEGKAQSTGWGGVGEQEGSRIRTPQALHTFTLDNLFRKQGGEASFYNIGQWMKTLLGNF